MKLETLITECTIYNFELVLEKEKAKNWLKIVSTFANDWGASFFFNNDSIVEDVFND